jgi:nicotinate-nucleotide pyrophosphorylase (carboxylating)
MISKTSLMLNMDSLILSALKEDMPFGDASTTAIFSGKEPCRADLICKQDGVVSGLCVWERAFSLLDETTSVDYNAKDGDAVTAGTKIATVYSSVGAVLSAERVGLNYLQRMSGIATLTRRLTDALAGSKTRLVDTRKTTPNMRIFEKYAVLVGGGTNHRYCLSDGIMLKDNHISAAGGIKNAIALARANVPFVRKIEVEVETLDQVKEAVCAGADIIMLDNMQATTLQEAINIIRKYDSIEIEISGNVTLENIGEYTSLGVDYISSGAITHSAGVLDISLKNLEIL